MVYIEEGEGRVCPANEYVLKEEGGGGGGHPNAYIMQQGECGGREVYFLENNAKRLTVNVEKTKTVWFGSKRKMQPLVLRGFNMNGLLLLFAPFISIGGASQKLVLGASSYAYYNYIFLVLG